MSDILDLPIVDIIKEKIKRKEKELMELQQQLRLLNSPVSSLPISEIQKSLEENVSNASKFSHSDFKNLGDAIKNIKSIFPINTNGNGDSKIEQEKFKFPSQSELRKMIFSFLTEHKRLVKTSELVNYYYPNIDNALRNDLTRRFSVTLSLLVGDEKVFSFKKIGERGDLYSVDKKLIEKEKEMV